MTEYTPYGKLVKMNFFDELPPRLRQAIANHHEAMDSEFAYDMLQGGHRTEEDLLKFLANDRAIARAMNEQLYLGLAKSDRARRPNRSERPSVGRLRLVDLSKTRG
jgi:hypothetical protein